VIRADVEQFCGGAQNRACALSLQEEVYRMALLEYHGGSATSTTALDIKPRSEEVHSAPLALQDPKATLLLSNGKMMPALAFGTGGRSADEVLSTIPWSDNCMCQRQYIDSLFGVPFRFDQRFMWVLRTSIWLKVTETKLSLGVYFGSSVGVL
jgi:hypothetical protein